MYKYNGESIYIAGPMCFCTNGYDLWWSMRKKAEYYGFGVTMPNDNPLFLENEDLRKNADTIFKNCAVSMNSATTIIADLELFRGSEPDGGTVFEIGMAYARGMRCYGFTRDKRDMVFKHQGAKLKDGLIYDFEGRVLAYNDLPFAPNLIGSCKIIEGSFDTCLKLLMLDIDEERKVYGKPLSNEYRLNNSTKTQTDPLVYLAGPERYDEDAAAKYVSMKKICKAYKLEAVTPMDCYADIKTGGDDALSVAYSKFLTNVRHVLDCDILIANLSDFHGLEPNSDTAFECGMGYQLGKICLGYMDDTRIMRDKVPHYGETARFKDMCDYDVENFNYPINLMFASSMPIFENNFEAVAAEAAKRYYNRK